MIGLSLARLALIWMAALVPPDTVEWGETYPDTADAIANACDGPRCVAILVALGNHESRFQPDAIGDNGQSVGVWQISKHWRPGETVGDHAAKAVDLIRTSRHVCRDRPKDESLGWYASGGAKCGRPRSSRLRWGLAQALLRGDL